MQIQRLYTTCIGGEPAPTPGGADTSEPTQPQLADTAETGERESEIVNQGHSKLLPMGTPLWRAMCQSVRTQTLSSPPPL